MGKRAPILGIAGLIFLVFGLGEHVMTMNPMIGFWDFGWFSLVHIAAGLICIVWFFASGSGSLGEFLKRRSTRYGTNAIVYSIVFVAVVVMLNYLGAPLELKRSRVPWYRQHSASRAAHFGPIV